MGKVLTAVLGLALLGGGAWYALQRAAAVDSTAPGTSAPRRQLDNVRGAASRIESEADARAKELEAKMRTD
ncbi:hypothetical protein CYFUS_008722 [Cystobacter fuscus]|uniref:Uncharacterized protein n=1 Tax=Cystobacter fuscus TaxID=43 RepID=A0A250JIE6_9BACT|nr:hypothetical protein [Cystobacter fuscus]ATB43242.1 hypothetical protein CYFUS_008722 [Cystobacter fuscus]